jgi:diguanylate cyclase (GGDEF)-like protein
MIDTDLFKSYNDRHGHLAGDVLLKTIGEAINKTISRVTDFGARFGGDEFTILLPGSSLTQAFQLAARLRQNFAELCRQNDVIESGLSIGIAGVSSPGRASYSELIRAADHALYCAKNLGRNRTEVASLGAAASPNAKSADWHHAA